MAKILGKNIVFSVNSTPVEKGVFDLELDEKVDEIDVTDSLSAGDSKEFASGMVSRSLSFGMWFKDGESQLEANSTLDFVLNLGTTSFSGTMVITGRKISAKIDDAVKMSYTARITGAVAFLGGS